VILHTGFTRKILEWDKHPDESLIQRMFPYLAGDDPGVLDWITDSGMSALIADNYAVEGAPRDSTWPAIDSTGPAHVIYPETRLSGTGAKVEVQERYSPCSRNSSSRATRTSTSRLTGDTES
jgi:hypothetical protein